MASDKGQSEAEPRMPGWQRWLRRLTSLIWGLVLLVLVLVALYVGLGRQWVHMASHYRASIEQMLSQRLGQPVTIGRITGSWRGLDPVLAFHQIEIHAKADPHKIVSSLSLARAKLDSVSSLLRWRLVFSELYARGAGLTLVQSADGRITVEGLSLSQAPQRSTGFDFNALMGRWVDQLGNVLSNPVIHISNIELTIRIPHHNDQHLQIPLLALAYHDGTFKAGGRLMDVTSDRQLARFALEGQHFLAGRFDGRLYLNLNSPRLLDNLLKQYQWHGVSVLGADVDAQAWLNFKQGRLEHAVSRLKVPYLQLSGATETIPPILDLSGLVAWDRTQKQGWRLTVHRFGWRGFGRSTNPSRLVLEHNGAGWELGLSHLEVAPWRFLLTGMQVLPQDMTRALINYAPKGLLGPLVLSVPSGKPAQWHLQARVSDGSVQAFEGAPVLDNLQGYLSMGSQGGELIADGDNLTLGFPKVFAGSWTFNHFAGKVHWTHQGKRLRVWSDDLLGALGLGDAQGKAAQLKGHFNLQLGPQEDDTLALHIGLKNGDASLLPALVPKHVVDPGLYHWLTTAIQKANIPSGVFDGQGPIGNSQGTFKTRMHYDFDHAQVRYSTDWPTVTDAAGQVDIQGDQAHIQVAQGRTGGLELEPGTVDVGPKGNHTHIEIKASAPVPPAALPTWLTQTPLKAYGDGWVSDLGINGQFHLGLQLGLMLGSDAAPDIHLKVNARDASLDYQPASLRWENINGSLVYDSAKGFSAQNLTGSFLNEPVKIQVQGESNGQVTLTQQGQISLKQLQKQFNLDPITGVSGQTRYTAELKVQSGSQPLVNIRAPLVGISSSWPDPLGKKAGSATPLELQVRWPDDGTMLVQGHVADRLAWAGRWKKGVLDRVGIALGQARETLPQAAGVTLEGKMDHLDVSKWQDQLKSLDSGNGKSKTKLLRQISLQIGHLVIGGQSYPRVQLNIEPGSNGWDIHVAGPQLAGRIQVPGAQGKPIKADLNKVTVTTKSAPDLASVKAGRGMSAPGRWPSLDASIKNLRVNGRDYGQWQFKARPSDDGVRVSDIQGKTGSLTLKGNLEWQFERGSEDYTRFDGSLNGGDLRDLSHWLGQKVPLKNKESHVEFGLHWTGTPEQFSLAALDGHMKFLLKNGTILQSNDAAQIFRIFGILNTDTIWRRLKLDFSDLYKAGVTFDAMSGKAQFHNGRLVLDPDMQIVGPSSAFRLSGSTDLQQQTLDMRLVVILPLTQNLPLAAVLLGVSPPVGGALFVLDKLLGQPLSKLTSATYNITGTWDKPDVKLRNVFDTGADLKKHLEQPAQSAH